MTSPIPSGLLKSHVAILGKTGSGKTVAAKVMVESILDDGGRVCAIDPTGVWHGLRSNSSGKGAGYQVIIFGGPHGDVPISAAHGEAIAEIVGASSISAVIDTSEMRVSERTRFFADFADALIRKNRGPLHLVIDECHVFMPQGKVSDPKSGEMLHAANNLVSLGRSRGLRITLISQRPAKVHKDSLTQVETLIAMRLIAPQDRRAVEDWISDNADQAKGREIVASLSGLKTGEAWLWAPELKILERVKFPKNKTYDSSQAPDGIGSDGPVLAKIDLNAIHGRLSAIEEEAKSNDPKRLKARIAELERTVTAVDHGKEEIAAAEQRGYSIGFDEAFVRGVRALGDMWTAILQPIFKIKGGLDEIEQYHNQIFEAVEGRAEGAPSLFDVPAEFWSMATGKWPNIKESIRAKANGDRPAMMMQRTSPAPPRPPARANGVSETSQIGAERRPLGVLVSVFPAGMTEAQWAVAAGMKRTGGTWNTYKSRLRTSGRIVENGGLFYAAKSAVNEIGGDVEPMPKAGMELVEFWCRRVGGAAPMLRVLAKRFPQSMTRDQIANALDMTASGGTFNTYLSRLRSPGLIEEGTGKTIRASNSIMTGVGR